MRKLREVTGVCLVRLVLAAAYVRAWRLSQKTYLVVGFCGTFSLGASLHFPALPGCWPTHQHAQLSGPSRLIASPPRAWRSSTLFQTHHQKSLMVQRTTDLLTLWKGTLCQEQQTAVDRVGFNLKVDRAKQYLDLCQASCSKEHVKQAAVCGAALVKLSGNKPLECRSIMRKGMFHGPSSGTSRGPFHVAEFAARLGSASCCRWVGLVRLQSS